MEISHGVNMNSTKTNIDIALMASHSADRPLEQRLFGRFNAHGLLGADQTFAFEARRYAYVGAPLALTIWAFNGIAASPAWEPYITLTQNHRANVCTPREVVVKTSMENAHMRKPLLDLGFFTDTGKTAFADDGELEIWELTKMFEVAFDVAHPESLFA
jgi:hypothetical protein